MRPGRLNATLPFDTSRLSSAFTSDSCSKLARMSVTPLQCFWTESRTASSAPAGVGAGLAGPLPSRAAPSAQASRACLLFFIRRTHENVTRLGPFLRADDALGLHLLDEPGCPVVADLELALH